MVHTAELTEDGISGLVEDLLNEAHHGRVSKWLPSEARERGLLFQKLRVVLAEALDNVGEHAYATGGYAQL